MIVFPAGVDLFRSGRNLDSFSYSLDSPISNQQSCVFDRRLAGAVDDPCSDPGLHGSCGGLVVLPRAGCERDAMR